MSNRINNKKKRNTVITRRKIVVNGNVRVAGNKKSAPKRRSRQIQKRRANPSRISKLSADERRYRLALTNPAHIDAQGVRVPDMYPMPTASYRVKGVQTFTSDSTGTIQFYWTPALSASMNILTGTSPLGGLYQNFVSTTSYSAVSNSAPLLAGRVISMGLRFKNLLNFSSVTGRIRYAPFVSPKYIPDGIMSATVVPASNAYTFFLNGTTPNILNMLGADEITLDELIEDELLLVSRPVDPTGTEFKSYMLYNTLNATYDILGPQPGFVSHATGVIADTDDSELSSFKGLNAWVIEASGLPANTSCFEVEYIYHVEGQPKAVTSSDSTLVPANMHKVVTGNQVYDIICDVAASPIGGLVEALSVGTMAEPFIAMGRRFLSGAAHGRIGN